MASTSALTRPPATVLAPMEGVTSPLMRELLAAQGGIGLLCTEFVRISDQKQSRRHLRRAVVKVPGIPLSVQVMGKSATRLAEAAVLVEEAGADVIDLNLGCPSPKAARGGVGAAMLKDPELLHDVVSALRQVVKGPFTAKMRAGFDDAGGALDRARILERAGVDWIAIHPRRRVDHYLGVADWRITRELARELRIPVIGNGDCWYAADALRMEAETGCAAVMIGRPALRNPFIFRQIAELKAGHEPFAPAGVDVIAWVQGFCTRSRDMFGRVRLGRLKEMMRYLARAVPDKAFAREVLLADGPDAVVEVTKRWLEPLGPADIDLPAVPRPDALERSGRVAQPAASPGSPATTEAPPIGP